ncbi:MAG: hypothetical protein GMKNLPBB_03383 [Myxococcota bacterium]|nr:hypothetical protein [Myxococcota bacterium]
MKLLMKIFPLCLVSGLLLCCGPTTRETEPVPELERVPTGFVDFTRMTFLVYFESCLNEPELKDSCASQFFSNCPFVHGTCTGILTNAENWIEWESGHREDYNPYIAPRRHSSRFSYEGRMCFEVAEQYGSEIGQSFEAYRREDMVLVSIYDSGKNRLEIVCPDGKKEIYQADQVPGCIDSGNRSKLECTKYQDRRTPPPPPPFDPQTLYGECKKYFDNCCQKATDDVFCPFITGSWTKLCVPTPNERITTCNGVLCGINPGDSFSHCNPR